MRRPSRSAWYQGAMTAWTHRAAGALLLVFAAGCHHDIRFEDVTYSTGSHQYDAGLVAVIFGIILLYKTLGNRIAEGGLDAPSRFALVGVFVVIGFESLARGRLLAFLAWTVIVVVGVLLIVGLVQQWRLTLGVLLFIGAIVLLAQNLREIRSSR